jgi:hypothetical protein
VATTPRMPPARHLVAQPAALRTSRAGHRELLLTPR